MHIHVFGTGIGQAIMQQLVWMVLQVAISNSFVRGFTVIDRLITIVAETIGNFLGEAHVSILFMS